MWPLTKNTKRSVHLFQRSLCFDDIISQRSKTRDWCKSPFRKTYATKLQAFWTLSWVTIWCTSCLCCTWCCGCPKKWQLGNSARLSKVQRLEMHSRTTLSSQLWLDIQWNVRPFASKIPFAKATISSFPKNSVSWMTELKKRTPKILYPTRRDFTWGSGD